MRPPPRPWLFDVVLMSLVVALAVTAAVLVTDMMCVYNGQPNGCYWPWGHGDDD